MSEKSAAVIQERRSVEFVGMLDPTRSEGKISGNSHATISSDRDSKSLSQQFSSDDDSSISSYSSSKEDCQETTDEQKRYEVLIKLIKDNEEKKYSQKSRSSSGNSSNTILHSLKTDSLPTNNLSDVNINEEKMDKKYGEIDKLHSTGLDFFLPSTISEKFQELLCEDSCEEEQIKNKRITFHNVPNGKSKKVLCDEKFTEDKKVKIPDQQYLVSDEKVIKPEISLMPLKNQNSTLFHKRVTNFQEKNKIQKFLETSSIHTRSEKTKKSKKGMSVKFHTPEFNLYKKITKSLVKSDPKKNSGRKDAKLNKPSINTKLKIGSGTPETSMKGAADKRKSEVMGASRLIPSEEKIPSNKEGKDVKNKAKVLKTSFIRPKAEVCTAITDGNLKTIHENETMGIAFRSKKPNGTVKPMNTINTGKEAADDMLFHIDEGKNDKIKHFNSRKQISKINIKKTGNPGHSQINELQVDKKQTTFKREQNESISTVISKTRQTSKTSLHRTPHGKTATQGVPTEHNSENVETLTANLKIKNKEKNLSTTAVQLSQVKRESSKTKIILSKNNNKLESRKSQPFKNSDKMKNYTEKLKETNDFSNETIYTQNINDIKTLTTSFPFILGQSTNKSYNVRAAIQQTMSMIAKSPAETLRRSSFSEMLHTSSKFSTQRSCSSFSSGRKVCPACVVRVDKEEDELDETPVDPWDTEYHSKRFIRCTCMPRNTVNFKTVMNQLLLETSSSLPSDSYKESEQVNGGANRVNNSFFRKNNNIYKLSKLLHILLRIRDLLVT